jgi:hypothetical protein
MIKAGLSRESSSDSGQEPDHPLVITPNGTSKQRLFLSSQDRATSPLQQRSEINSTSITSNLDKKLLFYL